MKILYVAAKQSEGQPHEVLTYEHANFHDTLMVLGHELILFEPEVVARELGRVEMNLALRRLVEQIRPDLLFVCPRGDQLDPLAVQLIGRSGLTTSLGWLTVGREPPDKAADRWPLAFQWLAAPSSGRAAHYAALGHKQVLATHWAANPAVYRPLDLPQEHSVSFVGRASAARQRFIEGLRLAGVKVLVRGPGWPAGPVATEEMVRIFNQSRINLNFLDRPAQPRWLKRLFRGKTPPSYVTRRTVEIPASGGFLLTERAHDLEEYYAPGKEVALFDSYEDLVGKVRHYLRHEEERAAIAEAGCQRSRQEHTYARRFEDLFLRMGLRRPGENQMSEVAPIP
jgi:spore maturation protein CgeB